MERWIAFGRIVSMCTMPLCLYDFLPVKVRTRAYLLCAPAASAGGADHRYSLADAPSGRRSSTASEDVCARVRSPPTRTPSVARGPTRQRLPRAPDHDVAGDVCHQEHLRGAARPVQAHGGARGRPRGLLAAVLEAFAAHNRTRRARPPARSARALRPRAPPARMQLRILP